MADDQAILMCTPAEAARRLSLGRTTVYEMLQRGELRSVHVGRARRIPVAELERWTERQLAPLAGSR